jgi:hypothetical protein
MLDIILIYKFSLWETSREAITWKPRQGWWSYTETDKETECVVVDWIHIG